MINPEDTSGLWMDGFMKQKCFEARTTVMVWRCRQNWWARGKRSAQSRNRQAVNYYLGFHYDGVYARPLMNGAIIPVLHTTLVVKPISHGHCSTVAVASRLALLKETYEQQQNTLDKQTVRIIGTITSTRK